MVDFIDKYVMASGDGEEARRCFDSLNSQLPKVSNSLPVAMRQVQEFLDGEGFEYDPEIFGAEEVLFSNSGNCLGRPLLTAALLEARGHRPDLAIVVNPHDAYHPHLENGFFDRVMAEVNYDNPQLATEDAEIQLYRFTPLEHLLISTGRGLFETTSSNHELRGCESLRNITADQSLSCVLKDRATQMFRVGEFEKAKELAQKGLGYWEENRETHSLLSQLHSVDDPEKSKAHAERYAEIGGDDSHFHYQRYLQTGDSIHLDQAIQRYPAFAMARGLRAEKLMGTDSNEARAEYSLVSQMYANSYVLKLRDFYTTHAKSLVGLFGRDKIKSIMEGFIKPKA